MKNTWVIGITIVALVVGLLVYLNHSAGKKEVPLSEIFSEEEMVPAQAINVVSKVVNNVPRPASSPETVVVKAPVFPAPVAKPVVTSETVLADFQKTPFAIQISSLKDKAKAQKLVEEIKKKNFPSYLNESNLGEKGIYYRVYVGRFESRKQAEEALATLQSDYKNIFIVSSGSK